MHPCLFRTPGSSDAEKETPHLRPYMPVKLIKRKIVLLFALPLFSSSAMTPSSRSGLTRAQLLLEFHWLRLHTNENH